MAYLLVVLALPIGLAIVMLVMGRKLWGTERVPVAAGAGAYRAGEVTYEVARRVPGRVAIAVVAGVTWGALTLFVLVPAGALLALMMTVFSSPPDSRALAVLFALVVLGAVISGVIYAGKLLATATRIAEREVRSSARDVARHGAWHHTLIWAVFPLGSLAGGAPEMWLWAAAVLAVPCGIGLVVSWALTSAIETVEALDRRDAQERSSTGSPTAISTAS